MSTPGFQPSQNNYTSNTGLSNGTQNLLHLDVRDPTTTDVLYQIGTNWLNKALGKYYVLTSFTSAAGVLSANWAFLGSSSGDLNTLTTDDLTVVAPTAGNINLAGTSPLSTTGSGSTATINLSGIVGVAHGGTGLATVTIHDLVVGNGTSAMTIIANGTTGQALVAATGADPAWGTLPVAGGGTGATTLTGVLTGNGTSAVTANAVTNHGVLLGGASNAVSSLAAAATGTVLAGVTGADPAFTGSPSVSGSVTAGTTITASAGNITATLGNVVINGAAKQLQVHGGAATDFIGQATLGAGTGTVTVSNTNIAATDRIFVTRSAKNGSTAYGQLLTTISAATSFTIAAFKADTTAETNDASTVDYFIVRQV